MSTAQIFELARDDELFADVAERAQVRGCILISNGRDTIAAPPDALITMPGWWRVGVCEKRRAEAA